MSTEITSVKVMSKLEWQKIISNVEVGFVIKIKAKGSWYTHFNRRGPGFALGPDGGAQTRPGDLNYVMPAANEGALLGRVGENGPPFVIGSSHEFVAGSKGPVYACMNDIVGAFGDNDGEMKLEISISS